MKLFILLISSLAFISAKSQQLSGKINNIAIYKDTVLGKPRPFLNTLAINQTNYKFLFKSEIGSVYESPVDHMRCLAPDFPSNMPGSGSEDLNLKYSQKIEPEKMPNALSKDHSIPNHLQLKK